MAAVDAGPPAAWGAREDGGGRSDDSDAAEEEEEGGGDSELKVLSRRWIKRLVPGAVARRRGPDDDFADLAGQPCLLGDQASLHFARTWPDAAVRAALGAGGVFFLSTPRGVALLRHLKRMVDDSIEDGMRRAGFSVGRARGLQAGRPASPPWARRDEEGGEGVVEEEEDDDEEEEGEDGGESASLLKEAPRDVEAGLVCMGGDG